MSVLMREDLKLLITSLIGNFDFLRSSNLVQWSRGINLDKVTIVTALCQDDLGTVVEQLFKVF